MRALSASELLDAWERGLTQQPIEQGLTLLAAACPESPPEELARLSIGRRDARLLELREMIFGPQLVSLAGCPACGQRLELNFTVANILAEQPRGQVEMLAFARDGYEIQFRLPNSADLIRMKGWEADEARSLLFGRCLIEAHHNRETRSIDDLPPEIVEAVVEQMAEADPQADIRLNLSCPACGHRWQAPFDIGSFLWAEVDAWAHRMLRDVHALASRYGWREPDILQMSARRRQLYLEMIER
jgi:hypothetical protein